MNALLRLGGSDHRLAPRPALCGQSTRPRLPVVAREISRLGLLSGYLALGLVFLDLFAVPFWASEVSAILPTDSVIRIHPKNPRYFLWKGGPTILVASRLNAG